MRRLLVIALLVAGAGCGADSPAGPSAAPPSATLTTVAASGDWPASAPEAEGLDRLAVEEYFNGWVEDPYPGSPLQRLNDCRCDWLRFVLDWRMREPPGARWEYVSGGVIVLGGIIGASTGSRLDRFANAQLFDPIGATGVSWVQATVRPLPSVFCSRTCCRRS